ncbi:MAG: putative sulfate exporter family transporter [Chthonomonas sp.]|nr:putative sulfate exporter family transporter [Chthonomonas sp.]
MKKVAPGVALCIVLALAAVAIAELPWTKTNLRFSPLLIVILLGMAIGSFISLPIVLKDGIAYCQKPVLRLGVALLGIKLSLMKIVEIGGSALTIIVVVTIIGFFLAVLLGRMVGLGKKPTLLLATGGSICGASAIVAADTVIKGENKDAAVSLAVITLWGTVGIFVYPALVHLTPHAFGVFCGATLHEVAQVVAAAGQSQEVATVTKLARVCLLAPTIIGLGWYMRRIGDGGEGTEKATLVPWFLWAFLAMATLRTSAPSLGIESQAKWFGDLIVPLVLSVGMAGVGLQTKLREVVQAGWKPIVVGLLQWVGMAILTIGLIAWLMPQ